MSSDLQPYQKEILEGVYRIKRSFVDIPVRVCAGQRYAGKTWAEEMAVKAMGIPADMMQTPSREISKYTPPIAPFTKEPDPGSFNKGASRWTRLARSIFGVRGNSRQRRKRVRELQRMAGEFRRRHGPGVVRSSP